MPTYDYVCAKCGYQFEAFQSMSDAPLTKCPKCKTGKVKRLIGAGAGFMFKGSGFYETDYKRAHASPAPATESAPASASAPKACEGCPNAKGASAA